LEKKHGLTFPEVLNPPNYVTRNFNKQGKT
jgi:hypothetical protein